MPGAYGSALPGVGAATVNRVGVALVPSGKLLVAQISRAAWNPAVIGAGGRTAARRAMPYPDLPPSEAFERCLCRADTGDGGQLRLAATYLSA